jgi:5-methylcytosine-specific restriction protein A
MTNRQEFTQKTKLAAWNRSGGKCEQCGNVIRPGNGPEYHHRLEAYFDGSAELENCQVLCIRPCHQTLTAKAQPAFRKARRIRKKVANAKPKRSRPMPGTKRSGLRKRMDGTVERR